VFITDFASSFKPTFLPLNDPSDFSYFYDSSGRRTCYIAPERFYTEDSPIAEEKRQAIASITAEGTGSWLNAGIGKRDGKVTEQMDIFAAGCVLLEMWADGASVFTLSEMYAYREGKYSELDGVLASIEDLSVRVSALYLLPCSKNILNPYCSESLDIDHQYDCGGPRKPADIREGSIGFP
jgi:phosphoinositide-3-kinase regulatory subunit 4